MIKTIVRFGAFLQEVREELYHVTWPTREELIGSTMVVFVGVTLMACFITFCDIILSQANQLLLR